ncbi:helix-turn-helix domain-containing protein [Holospora undulata]|uniref:Uncharacterized protein n=1 Tax=Holospora undulata HU1 TaxID=1321371 RepID=A0A061JII7_9PROT|nr:hypothetical protein [Holospora undulata]ETZ05482.1 hypothetical protein K737_300081 [Holospora undulata HU1]
MIYQMAFNPSVHIVQEFCYPTKGSYRQIAEALLIDDQSSCRNLSRIWATTYMKVSNICAHVLEPYSIAYTIQGKTLWLHAHNFSFKKAASQAGSVYSTVMTTPSGR